MKYFTIILILFPITTFAQIQHIQTINDGALESVSQVVISPDDRFVYAVGEYGLAGYERDTLTGSLTQILAIDTIVSKILEISHNGKYLFLQNNNYIHTYERNLQNGQITLVNSTFHIHPDSYLDIELTSDDAIMAVEGYSDISLYNLDTTTGLLSNSQVFSYWWNPSTTTLSGASGMSFTTDDQYFAVAATYDTAVTIFKKNSLGLYQVHQAILNNGNYNWDEVYNVLFSQNSQFLYVTSIKGITTFEYNSITQNWHFKNNIDNITTPIDWWDRITNIKLSKNEQSLFVLSNTDELIHYDRNPTTGILSNPTIIKDNINGVDGLNTANDIVVSDDGQNLYITAELDDGLSVFSFDAITKNINFMELHSGDSMNVDGLHKVGLITISPDGRFVYTLGRNLDVAIAIFERDTISGILTFIQEYDFIDNHNFHFSYLNNMSISSDGEFLFFRNHRFKRNKTTGILTYIGEYQGIYFSKIAPNDKYAISFDGQNEVGRIYEMSDDSVATLTLKSELYANDTISFHIGPCIISKDSRFVYGGTSVGTASVWRFMEVFEVDTQTLELKHIQTLNSSNFPNAGNGDRQLSHNQRALYVIDGYNAFSVYHRDTITGKLICVQKYRNNENGIYGLRNPRAIDVSPTDGKVFIVGYDSISIFQPNQLNDSLDFIESYILPLQQFDNFSLTFSEITFAPDGRHFYIASPNSNAIFTFENQYYLDTIPLGVQAPLCINVVSVDEEIPTENKIKVFPNPTSNVINIELIQDKPQDVRITIVNTLGQVVKNQKVKLLSGEQNLTFDISDLPKGIYFLNINGESVKILKL